MKIAGSMKAMFARLIGYENFLKKMATRYEPRIGPLPLVPMRTRLPKRVIRSLSERLR